MFEAHFDMKDMDKTQNQSMTDMAPSLETDNIMNFTHLEQALDSQHPYRNASSVNNSIVIQNMPNIYMNERKRRKNSNSNSRKRSDYHSMSNQSMINHD